MNHDDDVTEVLFRDWSKGSLVSKVVPESELFQQLYGDGGDGVEWSPKLRQAVKAQISFNEDESHEPVSKKVHERI